MGVGIKRILLLLLCLSFLIATAVAANGQRTYLMTDDIWQRADRFCRSLGYLGPNPVSPTTAAEIMKALNALPYDSLTLKDRAVYDSIASALIEDGSITFKRPGIDLNFTAELTPELYLFNRNTYYYEFFKRYNERSPFLTGGVRASFGSSLYMYVDLSLRDKLDGWDLDQNGNATTGSYFYSFYNGALIAHRKLDGTWSFINGMISDGKYYGMMKERPVSLGTSIGNDFMNFFIGRVRHKMGNGITGNMIVGDNFIYQEVAKFSAFSELMSYTLSLTEFDNQEKDESFRLSGEHQIRAVQRIDFRIFDKFRLFSEFGGMYVTDYLDYRLFMPMVFVHNWFNFAEREELYDGDEGNNILSCGAEWAFYKGFIASFTLTVDQGRLPEESGSRRQDAYGILANLKYTAALKNGYLDLYTEGYYGSPYLYLNSKTSNGQKNYMYDWIVGYTLDSLNDVSYSGHTFGPDTIALLVGGGFTFADQSSLFLDILYKVHGEKGMEYDSWPNQDQSNHNGADYLSTPSGIAETTLQLTLKGSYHVNDSLSFRAEIMDAFKWNYHNEEGVFRNLLQSVFAFKWLVF